jgi:hypothetical protein
MVSAQFTFNTFNFALVAWPSILVLQQAVRLVRQSLNHAGLTQQHVSAFLRVHCLFLMMQGQPVGYCMVIGDSTMDTYERECAKHPDCKAFVYNGRWSARLKTAAGPTSKDVGFTTYIRPAAGSQRAVPK